MSRQLVGVLFLAVAAILYGARHLGAMTFIAAKTGDVSEQYRFALQAGGKELLAMSIIAGLIGLVYLLWGEYESRLPGR